MTGPIDKVKIISYSSGGGAGAAGKSLLQGFQELGLDASFDTFSESNLRTKPLEHPALTAAAALDNFVTKKAGWESLLSLTRDAVGLPIRIEADVDLVILRWMNGLRLEFEGGSSPTVLWILDDMNPFTGACHYSLECSGFETGCERCPAVRSPFQNRVRANLTKKIERVQTFPALGFVAPTLWMRDSFQRSILGRGQRCEVIANPLDSGFLTPSRTKSPKANQKLKPLNLLLVAANLDDPIKGLLDVTPILEGLVEAGLVELTLAGAASRNLRNLAGWACFKGELSPREIAVAMGEADLLLVPSFAETAGNIVAEAASQGTPSLVRNVGGLPEMVGFGSRGWVFENRQELPQILSGLTREVLTSKAREGLSWATSLRGSLIASNFLAYARDLRRQD